MKAPTGEWKSVAGLTLVGISLACWIYIWMKKFGELQIFNLHFNFFKYSFVYLVYPPLPITFTPERQQAQLERMVNMQIGPIEGLASKYDYEKGRWKE